MFALYRPDDERIPKNHGSDKSDRDKQILVDSMDEKRAFEIRIADEQDSLDMETAPFILFVPPTKFAILSSNLCRT
jgi:hypothetical protein